MITLWLDSKTRKTETWVVTLGIKIYRVTVAREARQDTVTRQRIALTRALGDSVFRCLGNRRINGVWITEWMNA